MEVKREVFIAGEALGFVQQDERDDLIQFGQGRFDDGQVRCAAEGSLRSLAARVETKRQPLKVACVSSSALISARTL